MKFSLVAYLPSPSLEKVRGLQEDLATVTGSRACLDEWEPHITVGSGIEVNEEQLMLLEQQLESITKNQTSLVVHLKGFGSYYKERADTTGKRSAYVIWIECTPSPELQAFVESLKENITDKYEIWYKQLWPYHPHVTVAFRDLEKEGFQKGLAFLESKTFDETVLLTNISLVLKEETKDTEFKRFEFEG